MSGGPYGPEGVLSDFEGGGGGGVPKVYNRTDPKSGLRILIQASEVPFLA